MSLAWLDDERGLLRIPFKAAFRKWLDALEHHAPADHHCHGIVISGGATHVAFAPHAPAGGDNGASGTPADNDAAAKPAPAIR
jgi:hypothetical protein